MNMLKNKSKKISQLIHLLTEKVKKLTHKKREKANL